jgi:TonB family protein
MPHTLADTEIYNHELFGHVNAMSLISGCCRDILPSLMQAGLARTVAVLLLLLFSFGNGVSQDKKRRHGKPLGAAEVFKMAVPSIVAIDCLGPTKAKISTATGFVVGESGRILTNFHVIRPCGAVTVRLSNGDAYDSVLVVDTDERKDLALLRVKAVGLHPLALGDSNDTVVGQAIYSIGNPNGLQNTLQQGLVSAFRQVEGYRIIQVSASINPGNSGSPILDDEGKVVAVAVAKIVGAENLGFAIPIDYAKGLLTSTEEVSFAVFAASMSASAGLARPPASAAPANSGGLAPLGATVPTSPPAPNGPSVRVISAVLTRQCTPGAGFQTVLPAAENSFLTTDPSACFQMFVTGGQKGDKARLEWRNPLGSVARVENFEMPVDSNFSARWTLPIAGQPASFTAGDWQALVYWNNQGIVSLPFSLSTPQQSKLNLMSRTALPSATVRVPYTYRFTITGGKPPYRWTVGGDLAPGLSLGADGLLSGSPLQRGSFRFSIRAEDAEGNNLIRVVGIGVSQPPEMTVVSRIAAKSLATPDACASVAADDFQTSDAAIWLVFKTQGAKPNDVGVMQLLNPDGDIVYGVLVRQPAQAEQCQRQLVPLDKLAAISQGDWRVRLLWDQAEAFSIPLRVSGAPVLRAAVAIAGALAGPPPPPPPPVKAIDKRSEPLRVGGNVQAANLVKKVAPEYPALAKSARIQGTVGFTAVIAKDGTISDLQLIDGHPLLVDAASNAVKQWVYKPTLINGEPVEVITRIDVNFTLEPR